MGFSTDEDLVRISKRVMEQCISLKKGERVVIITNPSSDVFQISQSLYDAINELEGKPVLVLQNTKDSSDFAEDAVYQALRAAPDVVISMSEKKFGQDPIGMKVGYPFKGTSVDNYFHLLLRHTKQTRSFWSPGVTLDMWKTIVDIDYEAMRKEIGIVYTLFKEAISAHVTSAKGTDFTVGLDRWDPHKGNGDFREYGVGGNIPCGELYCSPVPRSGRGHIVFDGTLSYFGHSLDSELQPEGEVVELDVVDGMVNLESIVGDSCAPKIKSSLKNAIAKGTELGKSRVYIDNSLNLGELAIGMNRNAKMLGNLLNDEKVYGTAHVAIGANYDHQGKGEDGAAINHMDCLIREPTIVLKMKEGSNYAKEFVIMEKGRLVA